MKLKYKSAKPAYKRKAGFTRLDPPLHHAYTQIYRLYRDISDKSEKSDLFVRAKRQALRLGYKKEHNQH